MNNEQQTLIDEAFLNYWRNAKHNNLDCLVKQEEGSFLVEMRFYYKEEFINKCKNDKDFSEKWGLTIEERELSYEERKKLCKLSDRVYPDNEWMKENNIPTQLITITYQNKTITSYE